MIRIKFLGFVMLISLGVVFTGSNAQEQVNVKPVPTLCSSWFDEGAIAYPHVVALNDKYCTGYSRDEVDRIKFVANEVFLRIRNTFEKVPNVFPDAPSVGSDVKLRHVTDPSTGKLAQRIGFYPEGGDDYIKTWRTEYQLPPNWVYRFKLHRVPANQQEKVLTKLRSLDSTKLYKKFGYSITGQVELPYLVKADQFAHYARRYDVTEEPIRSGFYSFDELAKSLPGEKPQSLWVECYIPIDEDWIPVGAPSRRVTPIALQTTAGIYLFSIEVEPQKGYGGMIDHFEGRVFDLSACADRQACFSRVMQTLIPELSNVFNQSPLAAARVQKAMAPNQVRFQRRFDRSEVLAGFRGPYYELSTYTLSFWIGPPDSFTGSAESYFARRGNKLDSNDNQVFLQVSQSLQIAVGREGDYVEPSQQQYAAYQKVVEGAIRRAISQATSQLGGTIDGGIAKIK